CGATTIAECNSIRDSRRWPVWSASGQPWERTPCCPGKSFHGHASFTWLESGAFLLFHSHTDEPEIPNGVAILGTDDSNPDAGAMLYFDVRNVSREYRWTISGNVWTWSRDDPGFSQRMVFTIASDRQRLE